MRILLAAAAVSACVIGQAVAADSSASSPTPPASAPTNAAVNGPGNQNSTVNASGTINVVSATALEKGANSFTEDQARSRIESAGLTGVTGLAKDADGIWRAKATRDGRSVDVGFDYKGNIGIN